jgi:hypothetical protein
MPVISYLPRLTFNAWFGLSGGPGARRALARGARRPRDERAGLRQRRRSGGGPHRRRAGRVGPFDDASVRGTLCPTRRQAAGLVPAARPRQTVRPARARPHRPAFSCSGVNGAVDRRKAIGPPGGPHTDGGLVRGGSVAHQGKTGVYTGREGRHDRYVRRLSATGESRPAHCVQPGIPTRMAMVARAAASVPPGCALRETGTAHDAAGSRPSDSLSANHS